MRTNFPERAAGPAPTNGPIFPRSRHERTVSEEDKRALRQTRSLVLGFGVPHRDLEDVVQEVMLAAARSAHLFSVPAGRTEAAARAAWLWRITARCVARYRWRRALDRRIELRPDVPSGNWFGPCTAPSPEALLLRHMQYTDLHRGLAQLRRTAPEKHAVVVAHALEELPVPRIAGDLGLRAPVAWNRLHSGKEALRAHMRGQDHAPDKNNPPPGRVHDSEDTGTGKGRDR